VKRRLALSGGFVLAAAVIAVVLYRNDPETAAFFPPCLFHEWTGLHCAGCGSLRAFHAVLHGDLSAAISSNVLTTLAVPFFVAGIARESWRWIRGTDPFRFRIPAWSIWALLATIVAFAVLRNLPGFEWLAP